VRIYFASDIHGSHKCWLKFLNTPRFYGAEVIIVGGDITGKNLVPIVSDSTWPISYSYRGVVRQIKSQTELDAARRQIAAGGDYSLVLTSDEVAELRADERKLEAAFRSAVLDRVGEWVDIADERLAGSSIRCFVSCGNDDVFAVDPVLAASTTIEVPEGRAVELGDHIQMIGIGYANITPWHCPRDVEEDELACMIDAAASTLEDPRYSVFDIHVPPYNSELDRAPRLTEDLRVVRHSGGEAEMIPVGSTAVRSAIERYQPLLGLHGHVHESRGVQRIGSTTVVNPGSEYQEGILNGVLVDIDRRKGVRRTQLMSG
jgi:Icc-related predicted phosphoesterase